MAKELISKPSLFQQGDWEKIEKVKRDFIHHHISPSSEELLRPEIAFSWERSAAYGVDPYKPLFPPDPSIEKNKLLFSENELLLKTAEEMITDNIMKMFAITHFVVVLFDRHLNLLRFFCNPEDKGYFTTIANDGIPHTDSGIEYIASSSKEEILGTTAPLLALRYGAPMQTNGPENFHYTMTPTTMSAAPITNSRNQIIGIIALSRETPKEYWTIEAHNDQTSALCWTSTMALAISQQIQIKENNESLRNTNSVLEATLTFVDEGILLVDFNGEIVKTNRKATEILGLDNIQERRRNFKEFLKEDSQLIHMMFLRANVDNFEDTLTTLHGTHRYLFSMRPILHDHEKESSRSGVVIRISDPKQIDSYIAKNRGNQAMLNFNDILGNSAAINEAKDRALRFASSYENVLLLGESGTGKEVFAQSIHNASRPNGPFIALNCAAMPRNLVESELLGYEGGSFTGANQKGRPGKIELARGGTLFLDEIGDMPFEIQAVLLRVLENHQVMRIGSDKYIDVEFRLIAATNQDLKELVDKKLFRADLYYRLSALIINIPPLRERDGDILELAELFKREYCKKMKWQEPALSAEAAYALSSCSWPGNVRQLQKAMIYAITSCRGEYITKDDLPEDVTNNHSEKTASGFSCEKESLSPVKEAEASAIRTALSTTGGDVTKAAELLKMGRSTLYTKIKKYDIVINHK
ncbi:MAG: sigma-54 interaction domain-containing protein [Clostridia bacterium]